MHLNRRHTKIVTQVLDQWQEDNLLNEAEYNRLKGSIITIPFDFRRLALFSFIVSVLSLLIALSSLFANWPAFIEFILAIPPSIRLLVLIVVAIWVYRFAYRLKERRPNHRYGNEAIAYIGVIITGFAIAQFGEVVDNGSNHYQLLILMATFIYLLIGQFFDYASIWLTGLLAFSTYLGAETGYISGWGAYYFGMSKPLYFVLLGGILSILALQKLPFISKKLRQTTLIVGQLYLFMALWMLSIFADSESLDFFGVNLPNSLLFWSILFAIASLISIFHGLKNDNGITRNFGITFLFINLYTRYFEYFWDTFNKAVFFSVIAISLWLLGRYATKRWHQTIASIEK